MSPKLTKKCVNIGIRRDGAAEWGSRFEQVGVDISSKRANRFVIKATPEEFQKHRSLVEQAVVAAVADYGV